MLVCLFVLNLGQCPVPEGSWEQAAQLPEARDQTAFAVANGIVYVFGGHNDCGLKIAKTCDRAESYDPEADSWTRLADIPTGRGMAAAAAVDGKIYYIGGNRCFSNCWLTINEAYDIKLNSWTKKADMPTRRGLHTGNAVNGKIYVMGGADSYKSPSTYSIVEIYDTNNDSWSSGIPMPRRRAHHASVELNGKIYLIGGSNDEKGPSELIKEIDVFDIQSGTWSTIEQLPTPRILLMASVMNDKINAIGGLDFSNNPLSLVESYDLTNKCWTIAPPLKVERHSGSAASIGNRIYVIGGYNNAGISSENEVFGKDSIARFFIKQEANLVSIMLNNKIPVRAGTICLQLDPTSFKIEEIIEGTDIQDNSEIFISTSVLNESNEELNGGMILGWYNNVKKNILLNPGEHEIFKLRIELASEEFDFKCNKLKFIDGIKSGVENPPQRSIITDEKGKTIFADTENKELCLCTKLQSEQNILFPIGKEGDEYNFCFKVKGGVLPYKVNVNGTIPPGLVVFSTDEGNNICIEGISEEGSYGKYEFDQEICDSCPNKPQCVTIEAGITICPNLSIESEDKANELPKGYEGIPYYTVVVCKEEKPPPYVWNFDSSQEVPEDLFINEISGEISGTPKDGKIYILKVILKDSNQNSKKCFAEREFELQIYSKPVIATDSLRPAGPGESYNSKVEPNADVNLPPPDSDPIKWYLVDGEGELPPNLELDKDTGEIIGNVSKEAAGKTYQFKIQACTEGENVKNCSESKPLEIVVKAEPEDGDGPSRCCGGLIPPDKPFDIRDILGNLIIYISIILLIYLRKFRIQKRESLKERVILD